LGDTHYNTPQVKRRGMSSARSNTGRRRRSSRRKRDPQPAGQCAFVPQVEIVYHRLQPAVQDPSSTCINCPHQRSTQRWILGAPLHLSTLLLARWQQHTAETGVQVRPSCRPNYLCPNRLITFYQFWQSLERGQGGGEALSYHLLEPDLGQSSPGLVGETLCWRETRATG